MHFELVRVTERGGLAERLERVRTSHSEDGLAAEIRTAGKS
jgi:hypothetical protein